MPGFLCFQSHFYVASHPNDSCPACQHPAHKRLEAPDEAGPLVVPNGYFDEHMVSDANGRPVTVRTERVEPQAGAPWVACTEPVWSLRDGHHGYGFRFEAHRLPQALMSAIRASVCNQWIDSDDYKRNRSCHPFLQGYDEASGWLLVEFSVRDRQDCLAVANHLAGLCQAHVDQTAAPTPSRKVKP